jgi:hypothetical protein
LRDGGGNTRCGDLRLIVFCDLQTQFAQVAIERHAVANPSNFLFQQILVVDESSTLTSERGRTEGYRTVERGRLLRARHSWRLADGN